MSRISFIVSIRPIKRKNKKQKKHESVAFSLNTHSSSYELCAKSQRTQYIYIRIVYNHSMIGLASVFLCTLEFDGINGA